MQKLWLRVDLWLQFFLKPGREELELFAVRGSATYYLRSLLKVLELTYESRFRTWLGGDVTVDEFLLLLKLFRKLGFTVQDVWQSGLRVTWYMETTRLPEEIAAEASEITQQLSKSDDVFARLSELVRDVPSVELPERARAHVWLIQQLNRDLEAAVTGLGYRELVELVFIRYMYKLLKLYPEFDAACYTFDIPVGKICLARRSKYQENTWYTDEKWKICELFTRELDLELLITRDRRVYWIVTSGLGWTTIRPLAELDFVVLTARK